MQVSKSVYSQHLKVKKLLMNQKKKLKKNHISELYLLMDTKAYSEISEKALITELYRRYRC